MPSPNTPENRMKWAARARQRRATHGDQIRTRERLKATRYRRKLGMKPQRIGPDRSRAALREHKDRRRIVSMIIRAYGNRCACCGIDAPQFLTMDHINNDGAKDRKQNGADLTWYKRQLIILATRGARPDLRVLCYNCNIGRQMWGYCHDNPQGTLV